MTFHADLVAVAPLISAVLAAVAVLLVDLVLPGRRMLALGTALVGLAVTAAVTLATGTQNPNGVVGFEGAYTIDGLTTFLNLLFISIVALTIVFAPDYLEPRDLPLAEFAIVLIFAMSGAMLIAGSTDLLLLFLGLELMVLPGYMLAGFHKTDGYSTEGAIKYFLLGSFSSAIFLFGLAFVWGLTGTTRVDGVAEILGQVTAGAATLSPGLAMGLAFMTTGVAFKIAAVPFHYWTPDAYQGSPTPVTGYLSVGPKVGAFALILRLFVEGLGPLRDEWLPVVVVLAALTMTLGNLVALTQNNVKRMLAYSSIAHTGYMLMGLAAYAAGVVEGLGGLLYYGAAYTFMNLGAFAIVAALQRRTGVDLQPRHVRRPDPPRALAGAADDAVPAVADGHPAHRRLLRQGVRDLPGGRGRRQPRGAGRDRGPQRRRGRVLLPAGRALHVRPRARHRCAGAVAQPADVGRPGNGHDPDDPDRVRLRSTAPTPRRGGRRDRLGPSQGWWQSTLQRRW